MPWLRELLLQDERSYNRRKLIKCWPVASLSVTASLCLCLAVSLPCWAQLKIPQHRYYPMIGEYVGPANLTTLYLGLFTTSQGTYGELFKSPADEEVKKLSMVASLMMLSLSICVAAALIKVIAQFYSRDYALCKVLKRYKAAAVLNIFAVILNIGCLMIWLWFTQGFTHGRYTLGARIRYEGSVYIMLGACALLLAAIGLDFISCHCPRRRPSVYSTEDVLPVDLREDLLDNDPPPPYEI